MNIKLKNADLSPDINIDNPKINIKINIYMLELIFFGKTNRDKDKINGNNLDK